jgi:hypothetical protein
MYYKAAALISAAVLFVGTIAVFKQELIALTKPSPDTGKTIQRPLTSGIVDEKTVVKGEGNIEQPSGNRKQVKWVQFDRDLHIDPFSRAEYSVFRTGITTLTNYESISSAQMFGLSEVETVIFDCQESKMSSNGTKWYQGQFAAGKLTKEFPAELNEWYPISRHYLRLFAEICS